MHSGESVIKNVFYASDLGEFHKHDRYDHEGSGVDANVKKTLR